MCVFVISHALCTESVSTTLVHSSTRRRRRRIGNRNKMSRLFATSIFSNTLSVSARVHAKRTTNHCFMFSSQSSQLRCVVGTDRVSCATSSQKERRTVTVRGRTACLAFFCSASSSQGVERSTSTSSSTQTSDEEDEYERKNEKGIRFCNPRA